MLIRCYLQPEDAGILPLICLTVAIIELYAGIALTAIKLGKGGAKWMVAQFMTLTAICIWFVIKGMVSL
jgi:hypothetical protein